MLDWSILVWKAVAWNTIFFVCFLSVLSSLSNSSLFIYVILIDPKKECPRRWSMGDKSNEYSLCIQKYCAGSEPTLFNPEVPHSVSSPPFLIESDPLLSLPLSLSLSFLLVVATRRNRFRSPIDSIGLYSHDTKSIPKKSILMAIRRFLIVIIGSIEENVLALCSLEYPASWDRDQ